MSPEARPGQDHGPKTGRCSLAGTENGIDRAWSQDTIIGKAHGGCGRGSIGEIPAKGFTRKILLADAGRFVTVTAAGRGHGNSCQYVSECRAHYDWKLSIQWGIALREDPKDAKAEGPAVTSLRPEGYAVTLHLFLSDAVTLADVAVPANVEVKSGGEIEHFVAQHKVSQGPAKP